MNKYEFLDKHLTNLENKNRTRSLKNIQKVSAREITLDKTQYLNFSSNDYLGLSSKISISDSKSTSSGATASRLVSGNLELNSQLEAILSKWKGTEDCLLLNSGYQANTGLIPAIADRHTLIFSDKLNHASIIDGIKLSGAKQIRYKHNDIDDLKTLLLKYKTVDTRKIIISESLFSMDGDYSNLSKLINLSQDFNCLLYIDDAHGSGISGKAGIGPCEFYMNDIDIYVSTFGKAHGSFGAYCCTNSKFKKYLVNTTRTLIYSTGLPPSLLQQNINSTKKIIIAETERQSLYKNIKNIRKFLQEKSFETIESESPIIPIIVGSDQDALNLSEHLRSDGIICLAIRPPTVPEGTARIRLTVTADHTESDIKQLKKSLLKWKNAR
ncbi:MAG: 8-amino-7-oxononanoate synthase [Lentisphaeraceae bacterium]|nr:8-amino-7-oxononanoate synthase [Lentisphaeraceae bacterium]